MAKILVLAYDFPPNNSVGGQRPYGWFRYMPELGVEVTVVTRHWDTINLSEDTIRPSTKQQVEIEQVENGSVIRTSYNPNLRDRILLRHGIHRWRFLRKVLSFTQIIGQYFIAAMDNKRAIYSEARKLLGKKKFDVIIATGEPFVLFKYADLLSKEFETPWVADYRDGWSMNYNILHSSVGLSRWINHNLMGHIERSLVSSSSMITCTVSSHKAELEKVFPNKRVQIIYNGFFHELFCNLESVKANEQITIGYAGTIYPYQQLETYVDAVIGSEKPQPLTIFYGSAFDAGQQARIEKAFGKHTVLFETTERMPHQTVLDKLANCDALLLLATSDVHQLYAKVFDYMALGKPMIVCLNDKGPLEELLKDQPNVFLCNDRQQVQQAVESLRECVVQTADSSSTDLENHPYSRKTQAKRLLEILNSEIISK